MLQRKTVLGKNTRSGWVFFGGVSLEWVANPCQLAARLMLVHIYTPEGSSLSVGNLCGHEIPPEIWAIWMQTVAYELPCVLLPQHGTPDPCTMWSYRLLIHIEPPHDQPRRQCAYSSSTLGRKWRGACWHEYEHTAWGQLYKASLPNTMNYSIRFHQRFVECMWQHIQHDMHSSGSTVTFKLNALYYSKYLKFWPCLSLF